MESSPPPTAMESSPQPTAKESSPPPTAKESSPPPPPPTPMVLPANSTSTTAMCPSLMLEFTMLPLLWLPLLLDSLTPPKLVSASTTRVSKFPAKLLRINMNISIHPVTAEQSNTNHQNCYHY